MARPDNRAPAPDDDTAPDGGDASAGITVKVRAEGYDRLGEQARHHVETTVRTLQDVIGQKITADEARARLAQSADDLGEAVGAARVRVGDADGPLAGDTVRVRFDGGDTAFGRVAEVHTDGEFERGDERLRASDTDPVFRVDVLRPVRDGAATGDDAPDGWARGGVQTVHTRSEITGPVEASELPQGGERGGTIYDAVTVDGNGAGHRFGYGGSTRAVPTDAPDPIDPREGMTGGTRFQGSPPAGMAERINPPEIGEVRTTVPMQAGFAAETGDDGQRISIPINTDDLDRHKTIIEPGGAELDAYRMNPVVLINHNRSLVAGTSEVSKQEGELVASMGDSRWDDEDEEIAKWHRKVKKKIIRAASIGFRVLEYREERTEEIGRYYRITKWELVEWSWVSVPSNPFAVARSAGNDVARRANEAVERLATGIEQLFSRIDGTGRGNDPDPAPSAAETRSTTPADDAPDDDDDTRAGSTPDDDPEGEEGGSGTRTLTFDEFNARRREIQRKRQEKAEEKAKRRAGQR